MKKIALIGSTGSIGKQVLNVVRRHGDKFKIVSLSAGDNSRIFFEQVKEFKPSVATLKSEPCDFDKHQFIGTEFYFGENAFLNGIVSECDIVVISLVGFTGIIAVLDAIKKGKDIALANKESLVVGGELVMKMAKEKGVKILPIDSEHSAIWQALNFDFEKPFSKIILTASGGAFRDKSLSELKNLSATEALQHPNWQMGAKITIDCATLVNKAFEVIEAKWLYNTSFDKISVIIHRESIIHSMVEFLDKSVIAQLSYPTMELPIALALNYPTRIESNLESLDFAKLKTLTFEEPDLKRFPSLDLVINAGKMGNTYPAVANGANEQAVKMYLSGQIKFLDIQKSIEGALNLHVPTKVNGIEDLISANAFATDTVKKMFGE